MSPSPTPVVGSFESREFDLLCLCSAGEVGPKRATAIARTNESVQNWEELLRLAEYHGVLPLLARNLLAHGQAIPANIEQKLRSVFAANLRRNLWFAGELVRIVKHFGQKNLLVLPYKGPALAERCYGDLALRSFSDLDFLISPPELDSATEALAELGYQPSTPLTPTLQRASLEGGYELAFDSAAGKYLVELQWALLPHLYAVDLRSDDLLARAGQATPGGREGPSLSPEDTLLVLCLHAAKHLWMRLLWACDIAETVRTQAIDYPLLRSRARDLGILRIVGVSLWIAREVLGSALPGPAEEIVRSDSQVEILGREYASRLARATTYNFESAEYFRRILRLRERRSDRIRCLCRLLWTPSVGDVASVRLPPSLFPLYRVVRIARMLRRLV